MKKNILFLLILVLFFIPLPVFADSIYSVKMDINILEDGTANIKEVWDVEADSGSEWYKSMYELNNSEISNYKVTMDGEELSYINWNTSASLQEKKGNYGINNTSNGIELCFGKGDYNRHTFVITYSLSNYVFNTKDSQVLAWVIYPKANVDYFSAEISSYYQFPDNLDVWGYGYKGYAYVEDGIIKLSTEGSLRDNYVSVLVKFPLNTFRTSNIDDRYNTFDDVFKVAEEGSFQYDYGTNDKFDFFAIFFSFISFLFPVFIFLIIFIIASSDVYGYINYKFINKKNTPMFREIPCNKDIYYANALIKLNNFDYKESNIFGAIILKWVKEGKIKFKNEEKGLFNKKTSMIDLTDKPVFDNKYEKEIFDIMYEASNDGILEPKELEKWCRKNYSKFFGIFKRIVNEKIQQLKLDGYIYKRKNKQECKKKNVMNEKIYNDSSKLYGLKLYLKEFSNMNTKEVMDVHIWDEYLMFAYLFGMADKVAKQLEHLYPDVIKDLDFDYNTIIFINDLSVSSVSAASSARSAAENYSAGGGGLSSGGGGGFSGGFSGGGGSAGGR